MSKGKFANKRRKNNSSKLIVALLTIVLVLSIGIGGTLAWLTAQTTEVTNTFTTSDITVELKEHTYDPDKDELTTAITTDGVDNYKMIPGWTIPKDPWAKVGADSEDCYLFVKVTESENFNTYMVYNIDETVWTKLENGVYYKVLDSADEKNAEHSILAAGTYADEGTGITVKWEANQVAVKPSVTKELMAAAKNNQPTLKFQAYAVQLWKSNASGGEDAKFTPAEAWAIADPG